MRQIRLIRMLESASNHRVFRQSSPRGLTFTRWGCCGLCLWHEPTELAHFFLFCSCVCFCLYCPFSCISFHKFSWQLSAFSLFSSGLISASLAVSNIYLFIKVSLSPDLILCNWLGLKHQLPISQPTASHHSTKIRRGKTCEDIGCSLSSARNPLYISYSRAMYTSFPHFSLRSYLITFCALLFVLRPKKNGSLFKFNGTNFLKTCPVRQVAEIKLEKEFSITRRSWLHIGFCEWRFVGSDVQNTIS